MYRRQTFQTTAVPSNNNNNNNNNKYNHSQTLALLLSQDTHEVPATAPVFEGHLYLLTDKQWRWRQFRFDGASFTCLSSRKLKLPQTNVENHEEKYSLRHLLSPSFNATLPRSQQKRRSLSTQHNQPEENRQIKFTIEISNISAISVLKRSKQEHGLKSAFGQSKSRCFCIRTYDNQGYVMKAQKQKDFERWLFVLTKMWTFAQSVREQSPYSPHHSLDRQSRSRSLPVLPSLPDLPLNSTFKLKEHPVLSLEKVQWIDQWRLSLEELVTYGPNLHFTPPPIDPIPDDILTDTSGMTSLGAHQSTPDKPIKRKQPLVPRRSLGSHSKRQPSHNIKSNSVAPVLARSSKPSKNWANEPSNWNASCKPIDDPSYLALGSSFDAYPIHLFQDAYTSHDEEQTPPKESTCAIRYHTSVRGKPVKVVENSREEKSNGATNTRRSQSMMLNDATINTNSPLQTLASVDDAQALKRHIKYTSSESLKARRAQQEDRDDMSLADLRRSLNHLSLSKESIYHTRSTSAPSILEPSPLIVAPALPPIPMHATPLYGYFAINTFMQRDIPSTVPQSDLETQDMVMKTWLGATEYYQESTIPSPWTPNLPAKQAQTNMGSFWPQTQATEHPIER
ncbi:hypothetical protein F4703DRAFT_1937802 [Phycomyces blakesleeanus]